MYKSTEKKPLEVVLPKTIDDGRTELILRLFEEIKTTKGLIILNWKNVSEISPAGFAILACLFDSIIEKKIKLKNILIKKELLKYPIIRNLMELKRYKTLPNPEINNYDDQNKILRGAKTLDITLIDSVILGCGRELSDDLRFSCRLITNELMQNAISHSGAERFYIYAGKWEGDFHVGVLDMGITIPAKLEQKYTCPNDIEYLELSLREGTSTRRDRTGGLGLNHIFIILKGQLGRLTIISRKAQVRRYFKRRVIAKGDLRYPLQGTWCFARFPLELKNGSNK